MPHLLVSMGKH